MAAFAAEVAQQGAEAHSGADEYGEEQVGGYRRDDRDPSIQLEDSGRCLLAAGCAGKGSGGTHHTGDHRGHTFVVRAVVLTDMLDEQPVVVDEKHMLHPLMFLQSEERLIELGHRVSGDEKQGPVDVPKLGGACQMSQDRAVRWLDAIPSRVLWLRLHSTVTIRSVACEFFPW